MPLAVRIAAPASGEPMSGPVALPTAARAAPWSPPKQAAKAMPRAASAMARRERAAAIRSPRPSRSRCRRVASVLALPARSVMPAPASTSCSWPVTAVRRHVGGRAERDDDRGAVGRAHHRRAEGRRGADVVAVGRDAAELDRCPSAVVSDRDRVVAARLVNFMLTAVLAPFQPLHTEAGVIGFGVGEGQRVAVLDLARGAAGLVGGRRCSSAVGLGGVDGEGVGRCSCRCCPTVSVCVAWPRCRCPGRAPWSSVHVQLVPERVRRSSARACRWRSMPL